MDIEIADPAEELQAAKDEQLVKGLLEELEGAGKREKEWRKDAQEALRIYNAESSAENEYNILFSNTETLQPALYNSLPRPDIRRRYGDEDPLGLLAARVVTRALSYHLDTDLDGKETVDEVFSQAVLSALVTGRGQAWISYDAELVSKPVPKIGSPAQESSEEELSETGSTALDTDSDPTYEDVAGEGVVVESVPWDYFRHGYAKSWAKVPWVARLHVMDQSEVVKNFGQEVGALVEFSGVSEDTDSDESTGTTGTDSKDLSTTHQKYCNVWEFWDRRTKQVHFVSPSCTARTLRTVDDPLELSGFFPCPKPLSVLARLGKLTPRTLYHAYKDQATELNRVTLRINKIVLALKVRGMYDSTISGLENVLAAEDNKLIPADNVAALQQGQSLERAIWLMPIDKLVTVLQQLYTQRQQVKQVIFEITGIADIMRGSSQASETLGAQQLKNQWGTLRLKKAQRLVSLFARDVLRLIAEVCITKFSPETLAKMTELNYPTQAMKEQAQMQVQQLQLQAQAMPQQPSVPGQPPQPPQQPQIPPELQTVLSSPTWEEILELLRNDTMRSFRIDIETNSTVDAEATEDKQDIGELLNSLAQFLNGVGPAVQQGLLPFDAAKAILMGIVRRYRFGADVEDQLKKMSPPPPQQQGKADEKSQEEIAASKSEAEAKMAALKLDMEFKQAEHAFRMQELQMKQQLMKAKMAADLAKAQMMPVKPAGITPA